MKEQQAIIRLHLKPFMPRKWGQSAQDYLVYVEKRLQQIQLQLDNWITMPTTLGKLTTHQLEDEKQLALKVKALLQKEIENEPHS